MPASHHPHFSPEPGRGWRWDRHRQERGYNAEVPCSLLGVVGHRGLRDIFASGSGRDDSICHITFPPESGTNGHTDPVLGVLRVPVRTQFALKSQHFLFCGITVNDSKPSTRVQPAADLHKRRLVPMFPQTLRRGLPSHHPLLCSPCGQTADCVSTFPEGLRPRHCGRHLGTVPALTLRCCTNMGKLLSLSVPRLLAFLARRSKD